jgi:hypothetical protein
MLLRRLGRALQKGVYARLPTGYGARPNISDAAAKSWVSQVLDPTYDHGIPVILIPAPPGTL